MRFLVPLAGGEDLFPRSEFHFPKQLVEIDGDPMIVRVINNLLAADPGASFIFIVHKQDCAEFSLDQALNIATENRSQIIMIDRLTAGAACSALLAIEHIDDAEPLVVCNGDQVLESGIAEALIEFTAQDLDAGVVTFPSVHPRWSFVRVDHSGAVVEAAEKRVISRRAIAGFYYFKHGREFVRAVQASIRNNRTTHGHYYIAPTLNEVILEGGKVGFYDIPHEHYQSFYSPQRVEHYERVRQNLTIAAIAGTSVGTQVQQVSVVIPMAGLGSRFAKAGYTRPKPFIDVGGAPMIERVMENLKVEAARFVLLARAEHLEAELQLTRRLKDRGDVAFVSVDRVTEGAACTVLLARERLDPEQPLLIANCDQIVDFDCDDFVSDCERRRLDGSILVFREDDGDPKWSFARTGPTGLVAEVQEKKPISNLATVGLYYFRKARYFTDAAIHMIARNERVNNEFYVCPVYNYAIAAGHRIGVYEIPADAMHGIGTPEDLQRYIKLRHTA